MEKWLRRLVLSFHRARLYLDPKSLLQKLMIFTLAYNVLKKVSPFTAALISIPLAKAYLTFSNITNKEKAFKNRAMGVARLIPEVDKEVQSDLLKTFAEIEHEEFEARSKETHITRIPRTGMDANAVIEMVNDPHREIPDKTRLSGAVYADMASPKTIPPKVALYEKLALTNTMHDDLWGRLRRFETDAVGMCLELFNAPEGGSGIKTVGGTLSIFMACLAAKRRAGNFFIPETTPNIITSTRAHPAFKKACEFLGIELKQVPTYPVSHKMNLRLLEETIDKHTILVVANAPAFPEGIIDDVEMVANIAAKYSIPAMVDCCLGGFLLPFCKEAGIEVPDVSFNNKDIWMITADTHKFGGAEKGNSVLLFKDYDEIGKYVGFADLESMMGMYATISLEGSRPTRLDDWLSMLTHGKEGYTENLKAMIALKEEICRGVAGIEGIHVSGDPKLPIFAIRADNPEKVNALLIASLMKDKGWIINGLPNPPGFHFCLTPANLPNKTFAIDFLRDLVDATTFAIENPEARPKGQLGMYDMLREKIPSSVSDIVSDEIAYEYLRIINSTHRHYTDESGNLLPQFQALCKPPKAIKDATPARHPSPPSL